MRSVKAIVGDRATVTVGPLASVTEAARLMAAHQIGGLPVLPVPLAGICARADLDPAVADDAERAIRASVAHAFAHPEASRAFVRAHAQEMSDEVCDAHIRLYVNELSLDVGEEGLSAIRRLVASS